jgi:hypothetical protein
VTRVLTWYAVVVGTASALYILLGFCRQRGKRRKVENHPMGVFVPAKSDAEAAEIVASHPAFRPKVSDSLGGVP